MLSHRAWLAWLLSDTLVFRRVASLLGETWVPSASRLGIQATSPALEHTHVLTLIASLGCPREDQTGVCAL